MKLDFRSLVKSFLFFSKVRFRKTHYDVVFYYPSHFNRGSAGENTLFEPLYDLCRQNNLSFIVFEEPDFSNSARRNTQAVPFDSIWLLILIARKVLPLKNFESFAQREWYIAKIADFLFFSNFTFSNCIVLSQSMVDFFRGLNPNASIFDYQHGVITPTHRAYIENGKTPDQIAKNRVDILVYGRGFQELLQKSVSDRYYDTHSFVLGQSIEGRFSDHSHSRKILFSLQLAFFNPEKNSHLLTRIVEFFKRNEEFFLSSRITIVLKHHPCFQHDVDPSPLYEFPFTELSTNPLMDLFNQTFLHLTFHSTTIFEASSQGIPTLLLKNDLMDPTFYIRDFHYPLGVKTEEEAVATIDSYLNDRKTYHKDAKKVYLWYDHFYQKLDKKLFVSLMRKNLSSETLPSRNGS